MFTTTAIDEILRVHARNGVPLRTSVAFALKLRGYGIEETASTIGVSRSLLFMALRGERTPNADIRDGVTERLGIDPWEVYAGHQDPPPGPRRERT